MKKLLFILFFAQLMAFASCDKPEIIPDPIIDPDPIEEPIGLKPGAFALNLLQAGNKDMQLKSNAIGYNLGNVKGTTSFSFILLNSGDQPIFDISLSVNNPQYGITPGNISILDANTSLTKPSTQGIIPIISLTVTHGTHANGIWYADLLTMGQNSGILTIEGKTLNEENDTIPLTAEFNFIVNAQIMEVKLFFNNEEHPLEAYSKLTYNAYGIEYIRLYYFHKGDVVSIQNTGNTAVDVYWDNDNYVYLKPGERSDIDLHDMPMVNFRLNGFGTIADSYLIDIGTDGKGHFTLIQYPTKAGYIK
jgi:hypothetical protein